MPDIKDYTIMEVGTWNGMSFTEEDLEDIANNFVELAEVQKVPLKLGHNDEQPVTDGQPALGWVENVRRVGQKLVADFSDVPAIIKEAMAKRLYRAVSIELLLGIEHAGKKFRTVLDAVAILGADQPAVSTLKDLSQYLASRPAEFDSSGRRIVFETNAGKRRVKHSSTDGGDQSMDEQAVQKMIEKAVSAVRADFKQQIEEKDAKIDELRKKLSDDDDKILELERENKRFKADQEEAQEVQRREAIKLARSNATEILEEAVKEKKITPAQRDQAVKMFGVDDDERVARIDLEDLRTYYSLGDKRVNMDRKNTARSSVNEDGEREYTDIHKEMDRRIRVQMGKDSKSYAEASRIVFASDPELHREYLTTAPPENREDAA